MNSTPRVIEGKTKIIRPWPAPSNLATVTSKDDLTAGNGAKHILLKGKAALATVTTVNVFKYLRKKGIQLAFYDDCADSPTSFVTTLCEMIPVEVVIRGEVARGGSYQKRHPNVEVGTVFTPPRIEYYYKTSGRRFKHWSIPEDDMLMVFSDDRRTIQLYHPGTPFEEAYPFLTPAKHDEWEVLNARLTSAEPIARAVFTHLSNAWKAAGGRMLDLKIEFGMFPDGRIVLADVIDCDSWRVEYQGMKLSKQGFRDGDDQGRVLAVYQLAAELTKQFAML